MTVEDPGAPPADNGEFWLFGYGSVSMCSVLSVPPDMIHLTYHMSIPCVPYSLHSYHVGVS